MPTVMTHSVVAVAAGGLSDANTLPGRFWMLAMIAAMLPDADVIGYLYLSIPCGHALGHRGFFHSSCFAALFSLLAVGFFFRKERVQSGRW